MHLLWHALRLVFYLLYHPFAWTYDWVADLVSFGRWKKWIQTVIPYLQGTRLLELGHGPGHLQRFLLERSLLPFGLDESAPMGRLARRNLRKSGYTQIRLTRGLAQALPFPNETFETVVATFPSEYIFDPRTLAEVWRVLTPNGHLIVLAAAWPAKVSLPERALRLLVWDAGQPEQIGSRLMAPFKQAGFSLRVESLAVHASHITLLLASKISSSPLHGIEDK